MINNNWDIILDSEYKKKYFIDLMNYIKEEYNDKTVYPKYEDIFNAFKYTDYDNVKVVILGQDPYHGENEAHGLSFSILEENKITPSLRNIFKELESDLGIIKDTTNLKNWAFQGVLLLNSILTVRKDEPLSHKDKGWEIFTDKVIEILGNKKDPMVFILWGNYAKNKKNLIKNKNHLIIESPHPSPFSANKGFFGSKPFSKTNNYLKQKGLKQIEW